MIKGNIIIKFFCTETSKETRPSLKYNNYIHERFYRVISGTNNLLAKPDYRTYITNVPNYEYPYTTFNSSIVSSSTAFGTLLPNLVEYSIVCTREVEVSISDIKNPHIILARRFAPIGINRHFNVIGLTDSTSTETIFPLTSLIIPDGCNQGPTEELYVYYNIEFPFENNKFKSSTNCYNLCAALAIDPLIRGSMIMRPCYHASPRERRLTTRGYDYINLGGRSYFYVTNQADNDEGRNLCQISNVWYSDPNNIDPEFRGIGSVFNCVLIGTFGIGERIGDSSHQHRNLRPAIIRVTNDNTYNSLIEGYSNALNWIEYTPESWLVPNMPLQSKFMKTEQALSPYFLSNDIPNNSGEINIEGSWNSSSRFPEIFRVQITKEGEVNESEYQIWIKKFVHLSKKSGNITGSVTDNYARSDCVVDETDSFYWQNEIPQIISFLHPSVKHPLHHGSFLHYPKLPSPWNKEEIFMYDRRGITLLNLYTSEFLTWSSSRTAPFNLQASQIKQISFDPPNNFIYVACKLRGLYRINIITYEIERLCIDRCYGVDVGYNSKVFAIFNGRLSSSDDYYQPIPFKARFINGSHLNLTFDSIWDNVQYIKIDRTSSKYDIAIVTSRFSEPQENNEYHMTNDLGINWWNINSSETEELNFLHIDISCYNTLALQYWERGEQWITTNRRFNFNQTENLSSYSSYSLGSNYFLREDTGTDYSMFNKKIDNWSFFRTTEDINPSIGGCKVSVPILWNDMLISDKVYEGIDSENNLIVWNNENLTIRNFFNPEVYAILDGDLILCSGGFGSSYFPQFHGIYNIFSNGARHDCYRMKDHGWDKYGWNGSNWIKNFNGSKITHSDLQSSIHGLNISFSGEFELNQYLLQYICYGLFHDNTTFYKIQSIETFLPRVTVSFPEDFYINGEVIPNIGIKILFPVTPQGIDPDPLFYTIEACNRSQLDIKVNGISRYIFYNNVKNSPDIGEVVLYRNHINNPSNREDYYLIFNSFDSNKLLTGSYSYLQFPSY